MLLPMLDGCTLYPLTELVTLALSLECCLCLYHLSCLRVCSHTVLLPENTSEGLVKLYIPHHKQGAACKYMLPLGGVYEPSPPGTHNSLGTSGFSVPTSKCLESPGSTVKGHADPKGECWGVWWVKTHGLHPWEGAQQGMISTMPSSG